MHEPAAHGHDSTGGAGDVGPWDDERLARAWWVTADERDDSASDADARADTRDTAARARDDTAADLTARARTREELAYRRIREITDRLNKLDAEEIDQHVHLQQAAEAVQQVIDSGAQDPLLDLLRGVQRLLDVQFADVIAASIQRSAIRVDLQHADQFLSGAADDRAAAAADRAAAAADRAAAAGDRDSALTARRQAATHRAASAPGGSADRTRADDEAGSGD